MAKYEQFASPLARPPTEKLYNHAISWQISFKFWRCSSYGIMKIWVKFQENWRGCFDHFLRIDTEWLGPQNPIYRLVRRFFSDTSRTTEGISIAKILQERFSWDLSNRSNSNLCLHLKFLRKSAFLLCFLPFWKSSWWFSKKFLATALAFLQWLYLTSSAFKDYTKALTILLGMGKNSVAATKANWGKKGNLKKRFFRFYAKLAADTGFRSAALEHRKNTTNNKNSKLFKRLYCTFCQLFFNFRILVRIFLDPWHNCFYSHYFCFKFGRML